MYYSRFLFFFTVLFNASNQKSILPARFIYITLMDLNFKGNNPGASRFGNFINYYQFHSVKNRIKIFPLDVIEHFLKPSPAVALDIGCNAGDLTIQLSEMLGNAKMLAIDIDPTLIKRSKEKYGNNQQVTFECCNFMDKNQRFLIENYLTSTNSKVFNVTFCFSITMWIHLNHGDEGLRTFLRDICQLSQYVVIEPQPWKCYRAAVKRMKLSNESFPEFEHLKITTDVENVIEQFITNECGGVKMKETQKSEWGRKLFVFKIGGV